MYFERKHAKLNQFKMKKYGGSSSFKSGWLILAKSLSLQTLFSRGILLKVEHRKCSASVQIVYNLFCESHC